MKRIVIDHAWEIYNMSVAGGVTTNVGYAYFTDNLRDYGVPGDEFHGGADELDWAKLSAIWKGMTPEEQKDATNLAMNALHDLEDKLNALYNNGKREEFEALIASYTGRAE